MNSNAKLRLLYKKHWPAINKCMKKYPGLSGPIVMDISDAYFSSSTKLMIVGQQTYGWPRGGLDALLRAYRDFNFGEEWYQSPFWNMTSQIADILGISRYSIAWTNLVKCDYKQNRPAKSIEEEIRNAFPVLQEEISILAPHIVIFFTGPNYDNSLEKSLPGTIFRTIRYFDQRLLERVSHPILPKNSMRTYHPNYLRRSGKENDFLGYIKRLSNK